MDRWCFWSSHLVIRVTAGSLHGATIPMFIHTSFPPTFRRPAAATQPNTAAAVAPGLPLIPTVPHTRTLTLNTKERERWDASLPVLKDGMGGGAYLDLLAFRRGWGEAANSSRRGRGLGYGGNLRRRRGPIYVGMEEWIRLFGTFL
jgi:hypothetical protein